MIEQTATPDSAETSIRELIERFQAGSAEAGERLWELYGILVRQAVRRRMPHHLRPVCDSEDFTQQVFASFFEGIRQFADLEQPSQLMAYLQTMIHNKVVEECRRRNMYRRQHEPTTQSLEESVFERFPLADREAATPSEIAISKELVEKLSPEYRRLVELKANGLTYKEVGEALGMHESSVRRILSNIYQRMME
jgi:RNA polymerase sigma-70 factor (ECF subfamily)